LVGERVVEVDFHEAVVSSQLPAVSSLLGCQNKRGLYLRVDGKQTAGELRVSFR
jgi:hypothetical protein